MRSTANLKNTWVCLLCSTLFFSPVLHAQYNNLLHKTYAERVLPLLDYYHSYLIAEDSVDIFKKINTIRRLAIDNKDEDLVMEADLMSAHYFYYHRNFSAEKVLSVIDSIKTLAIQRKKIWAEVIAENMAALYNFNQRKNYELAFVHHQRVYDLVKDLSPVVFPHKQNCLMQIADEYYTFNDFGEAIFYSKLALEAEPPFLLHPYTYSITITNSIGLAYQKLNQIDSADYYFRKAYSIAVEKKVRAWEGIASGNLGYDFFLRKQYAQAVPLLEKDVEIAVENGDWGLASASLMALADINFIQHKNGAAGKQLAVARNYAYRSGQYKRLQQLYPLLAKFYAGSGQTALAAIYMDSALFVRDSLANQLNALQMLRARQKVDLEKHKAVVTRLEARRELNVLERDILVAVTVLLMAISVYIYIQHRKKYSRQQEQARKTEEELVAATRQLNDFARNISEKNAMIELLQQQNVPPDEGLLRQLQQSTILTDADWEYFRGLFDKVHAGFLQRLKQKLPGLTPAETRFIALSKLQLSNKEMAAMLGVGADAIRQYRSRIRKKLDLNEEGGIEELVNGI